MLELFKVATTYFLEQITLQVFSSLLTADRSFYVNACLLLILLDNLL